MNKYNNPRLLNTVVSGTGMKNPVRPHVIIGSEENGFIRGDLMDANAIQEQIVTEIAAREHGDEELTEYIDEKVQQAVDDLVDGAPEVLDTLKELSEALGDDANFATTITEEIASKVDKVEGKGLSTNDYTTAEKQKLAGIAAGAEVNVQSDWNVTNSSNDAFIKNKPTKLSQFENDVSYATQDYTINNFETKTRVTELKQAIKEKIDNIESVLPKDDVESETFAPVASKDDVDELKENLTFTETTDPANGHAYVDLGLPSGTLWATMNVGAEKESDYGLYFAWGETQGYTASQVGTGEGQKAFAWADYKYSDNGSSSVMTKYNATDGKAVLDLEDDAARANWGGSWKMPTKAQFQELLNTANCTNEQTTVNGVNGRLFTSVRNGNTLFVPAIGYCRNGIVNGVGGSVSVWVSDISSYAVNNAQFFEFGPGFIYDNRCYGRSVRGVLDGGPETTITPIKDVVTDLKSNEEVIAAALNNLNTKIEATNIRIETFEDFKGSINEEVEQFTKFTPNTVGVDDAAGVFNYNVNQLQELVTDNNTEMLLTTTRNNKKLIVGTIRFFTDNFAHQVTAIATSNIHLDEWDKKSSLSGVSHTDGKAYTYVCFCGLNDPAAYSGLQEGVWTDWKKLYPTMDDLDEAVNTLKNRQYMDSSTFDAIFTEADAHAIDYIIDNFAPTFYVKYSSNKVTCSIVRSATKVCVFRNRVDEQTYNFIQECRRGTIGIDGTITWASWATVSSTTTA